MKTLTVIRHALAENSQVGTQDKDRPLKDQGRRDVRQMVPRLGQKCPKPDLIKTSNATRAIQTANLVVEMLGLPEVIFQPIPALYTASCKELFEIVQATDVSIKHLCVIGHNPSVSDFVNSICETVAGNLPPCGAVCIEMALSSWSQIKPASGQLKWFGIPE